MRDYESLTAQLAADMNASIVRVGFALTPVIEAMAQTAGGVDVLRQMIEDYQRGERRRIATRRAMTLAEMTFLALVFLNR